MPRSAFVDAVLRLLRGVAHGLPLPGVAALRGRSRRETDERKQREAELEQFFSLSQDLFASCSFDGYFRRANPAFTRTLGFSTEELFSRPYMDLVHPDDFAATLEEVKWLTQGRILTHFEHRLVCKDGGVKWFTWTATPVAEAGLFYCVGRDTTRQRADEEALRASNAKLEELRRAAEAANRAKSEFLANMSHEIRTPMTAILGFADVMLSNGLPPVQIEAVNTIKQNGEYLLSIINDILDHSKIEAGKLRVELVACAPAQILADAVALLRNRADARGLSLTIDHQGPIPARIASDPTRLRQVLINLIANAIKFTERGSVRCVMRQEQRDGQPPQLQFDIVDTGIGMSAEQLNDLFLPFSQVDSSSTRRFGGTGLGLAISKRLVEMLGGEIVVESAPSCGSTFTVRIPMGPQDQPLCPDSTAASGGQIECPPPTSACSDERRLDCRILLVDDCVDNQRLLGFVLGKAGAEVTIADNGQAAVELAWDALEAGRRFDVVLMDMQMPILDGYTATRMLRDRGYTGRIIALTAHAMSGDRDACIAAGCDDYATKPIDRASLVAAVARHLDAAATRIGV